MDLLPDSKHTRDSETYQAEQRYSSMAVSDIIGVQIHGRYQGQNIVNVMHYRITAQETGEDDILYDFALAWETTFKTTWLARHIDTYKLMGVKFFNLTGVNKRPGIQHIDDPGVVTGTETPSPVCRVVTLYTASTNFRRRGRLMLSGSEDLMFNDDDGGVTNTEITSMENFGTQLIANLVADADVCEPGLAPAGVLPFEPFTSAMGRKTPALLRSRRIRGFAIG